MPGLSLWLSPPPESSLYRALQDLITDLAGSVPAKDAPVFYPHITITSNIPIECDADEVVAFAASHWAADALATVTIMDFGPAFFKKLFLRIRKTPALTQLARECREKYVYGLATAEEGDPADQAAVWAQDEFDPHLSLLYTNSWPFSDEQKAEFGAKVQTVLETHSTEWTGGLLTLVPTYRSVDEWKPLASQLVGSE
ncbi:2',3'-cyclic-nucleotide 3'-phosphodiesterase [Dipodascopsis tothii]|uniref:2',3'-cyclic-nucleotide 3'-phosphodiesterase n=1 Tax=Dipodascopsis tothii TaxID=44089 RepID=UPI0034CED4A6